MRKKQLCVGSFVGAVLASQALVGCGGDYPYGPTLAAPGGILVAISPVNPSVSEGQQVQFSATVTGNSDTGVVWSIAQTSGPKVSGAGAPAIATSGLFSVGTSPGTYQVTASSLANPYCFATTTVTITAPSNN